MRGGRDLWKRKSIFEYLKKQKFRFYHATRVSYSRFRLQSMEK